MYRRKTRRSLQLLLFFTFSSIPISTSALSIIFQSNFIIWDHLTLVLLMGCLQHRSHGFLLPANLPRAYRHKRSPLFSMGDEIQAAVTGLTQTEESLNRLVEAAASATQESSKILGVKSLGVDYGLVRTGIAVTVGFEPKPLAILSDLNSTQVCEKVVEICKSEQANRVIVGLPLHKNGTEAEQTNITRVFASELSLHVIKGLGPSVPVYLWDERYTSKEAAARAHSKNPNRQLYGTLDADAACIILENYYDDNGKDAEHVSVPDQIFDECSRFWEEKRIQTERESQAAQRDRDEKSRWRKEAMERDRQLEMTNGASVSKSKKKKKKKKRKK